MSVWRPHGAIAVKAVGILVDKARLFAAEVLDDAGRIKGVRPLGGTVEFGETWRDAIVREMREELDIGVRVAGHPVVLENIYEHEGSPGHEIVFAAPIAASEADLPRERFTFAEHDRTTWTADWFDVETLDTENGLPLFPVGLKPHLARLTA